MTEDAKRVHSADGRLSFDEDGNVRADGLMPLNPVMHDGSYPECPERWSTSLLTQDVAEMTCLVCLRHLVTSLQAVMMRTHPEPHAYAVEITWNVGSQFAYWGWPIDYDRGPHEDRSDAEAERDDLIEQGYATEHLRIVAITVVGS